MTLFFINHQITIFRKRRKGSSDRYALSATFTAYPTDIQPASQQRTEFVQGRFGATYTAFIDATVDIKEGDQVRVIGGTYANKKFAVKGVQRWEGAGLLDHLELVLVSQDG
jgi:hypothetical protein